MASLRPPNSPSPAQSPSPGPNGKGSRTSMGPAPRANGGANFGNLPSPRPGAPGGRPTSELLGSATFQTPESEAIDQWFENLHHYEVTLEEMAAASLDVNFKEELSAIEQWFKVLSEAERTAALYSLLQHSTQVQIRFFITVLQQMARSDPMTALLSPAMGGSMQSQMEAKLASMNLKSPGLKSGMPSSPSARSFSQGAAANRQSLAFDPPPSATGNSFLSPDSASLGDAAHTLAQQRAKLKAANAAHRISAPALPGAGGDRNVWGGSLGQVAERSSSPGAQEIEQSVRSRPQSTDFQGLAASAAIRSPRLAPDGAQEATMSPGLGGDWSSMVTTPLMPMFKKTEAPAVPAGDWNDGPVPVLADAKKFRRNSKLNADGGSDQEGSAPQQTQRSVSGSSLRAGNNNGGRGGSNWGGSGSRSPALSHSDRYGQDQGMNGMAGLGMGGFNLGMGSPGLGMPPLSANGLAMAQMSPFMAQNLNMMNMMGMNMGGMTPEQALLAAQMAAAQGFGQPGLSPFLGMQQQQQAAAMQRTMQRGPGGRSPGGKSSTSGRTGGGDKGEDDVDPALLEDIPAWLRSLRLHKYTPNFENVKWQDMVRMDEAALERQGVAALGARRKMLKTFEVVRKKMGIPEPGAESA
ncbi:unnamed protein product [Peniophora sp. CBMAI 1063]|nr:unnamed protein product [Peniophora sp. CBMAI 1063]